MSTTLPNFPHPSFLSILKEKERDRERMTPPPILAVTSLLFFLLFSCSSACHVDDRRALLAFKNTLTASSLPSTWTTEPDCCFWEFVRCSHGTGARKGRVRVVSVGRSNNLSGTIPPSVADLPFLEILSFYRLPNLVGPIPPQISNLKTLQYLTISQTGVSGSIPPSLSKLRELRVLSLSNNSLTGTIPASLGNLPKLFHIYLYSNKLTGTIPGTLYSKYSFVFTNLNLLLNDNMLTGDIPLAFDKVKFLVIDLSNNRLTGNSAWVLFGKSKTVSDMNLSHNQMSFNLSTVEYPAQLGSLDISHNKIYGGISNQITTLTQLGLLDVSYNELCGKIPSGGSFRQFGADSFQHNKCLCGTPLAPCK